MTMLSFSPNQWAVLALVLVLGWLLGLLSRSGGAKWRHLYEQERSDHQATIADRDARIAAANARIAELERTAPAIGAGTAGAIAAAARGGVDDLTRIHGIDRNEEVRLNEEGYAHFRDIARMSDGDEATLEGRMGYEPGRIARENWRGQAAALAEGRAPEYRQA
ncbi:hypothetical protein G432_07505 [Sphingomonas sp. MM-1]|uniref:hypothetical protein n=1 Tax=Sphingomonas sp. MM-1 TaxID=745310 RepID=UPI0002C0B54F|nr:hypothetical protein [Sphingomonas sp. MM-1]AGH49226.1 hypothetical protein G432_07505 [Sphingomonas sp. MM-1]